MQPMAPLVITLDMLRGGDPEVMRHYFNVLVKMARRCIPAECDAEAVAREAMAEVLSRIASDDNPLPIDMLTRMAVGRAARRAAVPLKQVSAPGPTKAEIVTPDMLRRGDPEAVRRFFRMLVAMARRYIPSQDEAESAACEAMVEVLARLAGDEEPVELVVWARTAVGRAARRAIRRYKKAPITFRSTIHTRNEDQALGSMIQHYRDQLLRIQGVVEELPPDTQRAIVATVEGRTIESLAIELGVPASTLRNQLRRARDKFAQTLANAQRLELLQSLARQARQAREKAPGHPPVAIRRSRSRSWRDDSSVAKR